MLTTPKGFPYPAGTDNLNQGDDTIAALATFLDTHVGKFAAGLTSVTPTATNAATDKVQAFPAGRFANPPFVVCTVITTDPKVCMVSVTSQAGVTKDQFSMTVARTNGVAPVLVLWIAVELDVV